MFSNLFQKPVLKIGFEDLQYIIKNKQSFIIINTLPLVDQGCLIQHTLSYQMEESVINNLMEKFDLKKKIVVYGRNSCDETADAKCKQLMGLGFVEVYLYLGGMFEWLLLQDIYGIDEFPSTSKVLDILKYKPSRTFEYSFYTF
jgi:hypothetical protein